MQMYVCQCGYGYVVGKKSIIGPFVPGVGQFKPKKMTREEFEFEYGGCARNAPKK